MSNDTASCLLRWISVVPSFVPITIQMSFAGPLHLPILQLEPEEPTLLNREGIMLLSSGMRLRARYPSVVLFTNLEYTGPPS